MSVGICCVGFLGVGLLVAVGVYPLLHEVGHLLAAVLTGNTITDVALFPVSFVQYRAAAHHPGETWLIGLSGPCLPMVLGLFWRPKSFWLWYGNWVLGGISFLSFLFTFTAIFGTWIGLNLPQDDLVFLVDLYPKSRWLLGGFSAACVLIIGQSLRRQTPLKRVQNYGYSSAKKRRCRH